MLCMVIALKQQIVWLILHELLADPWVLKDRRFSCYLFFMLLAHDVLYVLRHNAFAHRVLTVPSHCLSTPLMSPKNRKF